MFVQGWPPNELVEVCCAGGTGPLNGEVTSLCNQEETKQSLLDHGVGPMSTVSVEGNSTSSPDVDVCTEEDRNRDQDRCHGGPADRDRVGAAPQRIKGGMETME